MRTRRDPFSRRIMRCFGCLFLILLASTGAAEEPASVLVSLDKAVQREVAENLLVYGRIQPDPDAVITVSLRHPGLITHVGVRIGQRIHLGDVLLELSTSPGAHMQYLQAKSSVDYAERELARQQRLLGEQLATKAQADAAGKALQDARATLQALLAQGQGKTVETVTAPTDGIITQLTVKQGDRVQADTAALAIASGDRLIAMLGIEPEDIAELKPGIPVVIRTVFVPGYRAETRLREIHAMINPATHLVDALAPIPVGQSTHLVLGSYVTAAMTLSAHTAITVARSAVLLDERGRYLFTVADGKARRVDIHTGLEEDGWIEITQGLQAGDRVVVKGNYELSDGMPVREAR